MPVPSFVTPTADLALSFTPSAIGGPLVVDFVLTPAGDLALVTGVDRLAQDVTKALYTPLGADPFNPTYGNALINEIGHPVQPTTDYYIDLLHQFEADFIAKQATDAAAGFLSLDEQADRFEELNVQILNGTLLTITLRVVAKSSASAAVNVTLNTTTS